jgi:G:T/U-mismatch repair DNA glycosylase
MHTPLVQALIAHFDSVFVGPNGDYAAILESLAGISAEQALWKPAATQNSIWQIVEHLIGSNEWQIDTLAGRQPAPTVWVEPVGREAAWQATLARLQDSHDRLKAALEQVAEADLLVVEPKTGRTLLELVLSSGPAHEAHHGGQIDYLKGLQAAGSPSRPS